AVRRAERRPAVQVHRGRFVLHQLRDAGRGRRLLGEALRGLGGGSVRLAQGQVRAVLAGRPYRPDRAPERSRSCEGAARDERDAADGQDRDRAAAAGLRRRGAARGHYLKMLTARAATSRIVTAEIADSESISSFAQRVSGSVSVGLNAIEFV